MKLDDIKIDEFLVAMALDKDANVLFTLSELTDVNMECDIPQNEDGKRIRNLMYSPVEFSFTNFTIGKESIEEDDIRKQ